MRIFATKKGPEIRVPSSKIEVITVLRKLHGCYLSAFG